MTPAEVAPAVRPSPTITAPQHNITSLIRCSPGSIVSSACPLHSHESSSTFSWVNTPISALTLRFLSLLQLNWVSGRPVQAIRAFPAIIANPRSGEKLAVLDDNVVQNHCCSFCPPGSLEHQCLGRPLELRQQRFQGSLNLRRSLSRSSDFVPQPCSGYSQARHHCACPICLLFVQGERETRCFSLCLRPRPIADFNRAGLPRRGRC